MTDLSGLISFRDKIQKYREKTAGLAMKIAEKGVEIAKGYYGGSSVSVYAESNGTNSAKVIAEGTGILFEEYGTGWVGEGHYEGNLPTNTLTFESAGKMRTTQGWEYHYPNTDTKKPKLNPYFWFTPDGQRSSGELPKSQMWKTSRDLRQQVTGIIKSELDKGE